MRNKLYGVSAVIGIILMVAITVAIAATVYTYVSGMDFDHEINDDVDNTTLEIEGFITEKFRVGFQIGYENIIAHYFVINNEKEIRVDMETYYEYSIGDYYIGLGEKDE